MDSSRNERRLYNSHIWRLKSAAGTLGVWQSHDSDPQHSSYETLFREIGLSKAPDGQTQAVRKHLEINPQDAQALSLLACLLVQRDGPSSEALQTILTAVRIDAMASNIRYTLGMVYYLSSRSEDAIREWRIVQQLIPSSSPESRAAEMMLSKTVGSSFNQDVGEIRTSTKAVAHPSEDDEPVHDDLGLDGGTIGDISSRLRVALEKLGKRTEHRENVFSISLLRDIHTFAPGALQEVSRRDVSNNRVTESLEVLVSERPEDEWLHYNLAFSLYAIGRLEEARRELAVTMKLAIACDNLDLINQIGISSIAWHIEHID